MILYELKRLEEAAQAYRDVLVEADERHFSSVDRGLTGYKARQNLAVVFTEMGDLARAEREWRQVTREVPRYRAGWHGLGEVLIRSSRRREALSVAEQCIGEPGLKVVGHLLKSRLAMATGRRHGCPGGNRTRHLRRTRLIERALEIRCQLLPRSCGPPRRQRQALRGPHRGTHPNDASGHQNLGSLLLRLKRYDEAVRSLRQALAGSAPMLPRLTFISAFSAQGKLVGHRRGGRAPGSRCSAWRRTMRWPVRS